MFVGVHFDYVLQLILRKDMPRVRYAQEKVHSDQDEGCQNAYHEKKKPTQHDAPPVTNQEARTEENTRQPHVQGSIREVRRVELRDVEREAVDLNVPQPRILRHVEGHTWGWERPSDARTKMSSRFELARAALVISLDGGVGGWGAGERIFDRPTVTARLKPGDMGLRDQRRHVCRRWTTCSSETGD